MKVLNVVGARPNFIKVGPIHRALEATGVCESLVVHTGQHYDAKMSDIFFRQLELPEPNYYLGVGGGSHAQQTAGVMVAFEEVVEQEAPDLVLVVGDVNSTLAATLVATKLHIPVAHVEAGLRSGDRRMPEELNRLCTDAVADLLFVTEQSGLDNLKAEGVPDGRVHFVGNVMIDSLVRFREKATEIDMLGPLGLEPGSYVLMTMHRPSNVDRAETLQELAEMAGQLADIQPVVFPVHPRTRKNLQAHGYWEDLQGISGLRLLSPIGYLEFLHLMERAAVVVTDSGGIQEETTYLRVPCLTLRENTERPITVTMGSNELMELDAVAVADRVTAIQSEGNSGEVPPLWDGRAAERIASVLINKYHGANESHRVGNKTPGLV
ncbi:MAG: UDP-N-acetylglucosamine 2-epimerase (non-hydrolyzing) [Bacteroidota bacterium]